MLPNKGTLTDESVVTKHKTGHDVVSFALLYIRCERWLILNCLKCRLLQGGNFERVVEHELGKTHRLYIIYLNKQHYQPSFMEYFRPMYVNVQFSNLEDQRKHNED
ncbi:uncharacterized protein LOC144653925 [Oculina patagonica]